MRRIGIYGGSFDPIHLGHLLLAESAREELGLERVVLVPAKRSPLKENQPFVGEEDRWKMVLLAIEGNPYFEASKVELLRDPPSYTVLTIEYFSRLYLDAELWLILGADTIKDLPYWYRFEELLQLAKVAVGARPGFNQGNNGIRGNDGYHSALPAEIRDYSHRFCFFSNPVCGVSSKLIRERLKHGKSVNYLLLPKIIEYITVNHLYL